MSYTQWVSNGSNVSYVPKEKDTGEVITPFSTTASGGVPNSSYAPSTYVLAASGAWIPQTVATAASEVRRPTAYTLITSNPSPYFEATDTSLVYDSDTNHITTNGRFELQGLSAQNDASFKFSSFQAKAQTWTSATLNISRNYASTRWTSGTEARYYLSTDGGTNWTLLLTDDYDNDPITVTIFSHTLATANPSSLSNYQVKVEIDAFSSGALGSVGVLDLQLYDIWIEGIYTVSGGSGTVTSITTTGSNGITISGGSTQTITTSGTFALALGNITPTSISTGTGSFSGDVEFAASIKSPNGSNSPVTIVPDGTGDLHVNADSLRLGDNNANATIATNGTGDLILTTHEGSATEGVIRLYDGANGNITLTPNGTGQVQVGSDQVVTLTASQTLTNKSLSGSSNTFTNIPNSATTAASANTASAIVARDASGNFSAGTITATLSGNATNVTGTVAVANGGTGLTSLTAGYIPYGNGTSAFGSSANLFWDSANSRLGIGTASPSTKLHVSNAGVNAQATFVGTTGAPYITVIGNSGTTILGNESNGGWVGTVGSQSFVFKTTDIERVRIDSSGNIGIGTSSINSKVQIVADSAIAENGSIVTIATGGGNLVNKLNLGVSSANNYAFIQSVKPGTDVYPLLLNPSGGNVGIGTSSPATKLNISGTLRFTPNTADTNYSADIKGNYDSAHPFQIDVKNNGSSAEYIGVYADGGGSNNRVVFPTGNVGIGTSSPSTKLHVANGGSNAQATFVGTTGSPYITVVANSGTTILGNESNGGWVGTTGSQAFVFKTNDTERMRITSGGSLLLGGTAVPSESAWFGTAVFGKTGTDKVITGYLGSSTNGATIGGHNSALNAWSSLNINATDVIFRSNETETARLTSSGNLGVGNTSPSERLTVTGKIKASDVLLGNNGTKGYGAITTTTSTSTPTGGSSGDHYYIY